MRRQVLKRRDGVGKPWSRKVARQSKRSPRVNEIILSSIPINREVKRYWQNKYERIATNCGWAEAEAKFKNLRVSIITYLSDENRIANLHKHVSSTGFRVNGMLRKLFEQADCQPHVVLTFLKMYSSAQGSPDPETKKARQLKRRLDNVSANEAVPLFLAEWLLTLQGDPVDSWFRCQSDHSSCFHKAASYISLSDWVRYWNKWYGLLAQGWRSEVSPDFKPVFPEIYKDYEAVSQNSGTYQEDWEDLIKLHWGDGYPLNRAQLEFVDSFLSDEAKHELEMYSFSQVQGSGIGMLAFMTNVVGRVHHIPKKGSGTVDRDIAVPNRFIQTALAPAAAVLYNVVRRLPQDATFDQDRFDTRIQNRVQNRNLYQGSVDLSKATDNLPFKWGEFLILGLWQMFDMGCNIPHPVRPRFHFTRTPASDLQDAEFRKSFNLFRVVARSNWRDGVKYQRWKVGQPLGTLPSFATLALTHNLFLEALGLSMGYKHSPYVVLGDDVVIFNKKLRKRYIRELTSRGVPLSLHKSYEGRLSEFAGKTYVRGCVPFYTSDHSPVTWNSLFDWQRSTGIRIPWESLPQQIKRKICKMIKTENPSGQYSNAESLRLAKSSYELVQLCEVNGRGSHLYPIEDRAGLSEQIARYYEYRETDSPIPDPMKHTGITVLQQHPVQLLSDRFADKDGYFQRYRPVELPAWYKAKVRPCATDAAVRAAIIAVSP